MIIDELITFSDGGSRGNPGPAAIGYVIMDQGKEVYSQGLTIGETTNNVAEYKAIIGALTTITVHQWRPRSIVCKLDSELVVKQLNGEYKIKQNHLLDLYWEVKHLCETLQAQGCQSLSFVHIPREQNLRADALVNQALDASQ